MACSICRRMAAAGGYACGSSATPPRFSCLRSIGWNFCPSPSSQPTSILVHVDAAEDAGDRGIGGVAAGADAYQAVQVRQPRRVEDHPAAADEAFEAGVEVRRIELIGIAGEIARRDVQRAAERDAQMRKIAAHAGALRHGVVGGGDRVGRPAQVLDVLVNPVGDGDDLLVRILDLAEQVPGQAAEPIGLAIAAGKEVRNGRGAQLGDRRRLDRAGAVGLEVALDRRRVARGRVSCVARSPVGESGYPCLRS